MSTNSLQQAFASGDIETIINEIKVHEAVQRLIRADDFDAIRDVIWQEIEIYVNGNPALSATIDLDSMQTEFNRAIGAAVGYMSLAQHRQEKADAARRLADEHIGTAVGSVLKPKQRPDPLEARASDLAIGAVRAYKARRWSLIVLGVLVLSLICVFFVIFGQSGSSGVTASTKLTQPETSGSPIAGVTASSQPTPNSKNVPVDITSIPPSVATGISVNPNGPTCQANAAATGWMFVYDHHNRYIQSSYYKFTVGKLKGTPAQYGDVVRDGRVVGKSWLCQATNDRFQLMTEPQH
jgi:hypothetical protein